MARAEDDAADKVGEGDVGRGRDGPAALHHLEYAEEGCKAEIDRDWPEHPAGRRNEWRQRLLAAERAVFQRHRLPHFLGGNGEEEGHEHVVDEEVQRQRAADAAAFGLRLADQEVLGDDHADEAVVTFRAGIRPDERDHGACNQQERIVADVVPDPIHVPPLVQASSPSIPDRGRWGKKGRPADCGGQARRLSSRDGPVRR
jgi:hypothetical protein